MATLNILFIADVSISKVIGGAERVLFEQTRRLVSSGHEVHILTRKLSEHKHEIERIEGVFEWRYPVETNNSAQYMITTLTNAKRLFDKINRIHGFDCLKFHQPFSAAGVSLSRESRKALKLYTCHSLSFEEYISRNPCPSSSSGRLIRMLNIYGRKFLERKLIQSSDWVTVESDFTRDKLVENYRLPYKKIKLVPGGVDLEKFFPEKDKHKIQAQMGLPEKRIILFTVRNLVQRMGLENLIASMKIVKTFVPNVLLIIGGTGPLQTQLEILRKDLVLENNVIFEGFISEKDLPKYYQLADLFVLPTRELEGFGLVTVESLASGVPVVGTPVGGTKEILGKFDRGFLFDDTSAESMARLIIEKCWIIKHTPEAWAEIGRRCRTFVEENYSWEKNIDLLETLMSDGLEKKNRNLPRNSQRSFG